MSVRIATLIGMAALLFARPALAQDLTTSYNQWFVNLVGSHMGHEFCPPAGTTYGAAAKALEQYTEGRSIQTKQLTDAEFLKKLSEIYPCKPAKELSDDDAKTLGSKPLGSIVGNYTVRPTGVYGTVDTGASLALLDELRQLPSESRQRKIHDIQVNGGDYLPIILMQVAIDEYRSGNSDRAIFWFHAGLLRAILDSKLCSDPSVRDAPRALMLRSPPELVRAAFADDPNIAKVVQSVVSWDAKTPYQYDHRWIALSGAGAIASALHPDHAPASLTVPDGEWAGIILKNREAYPKLVEVSVAQLKASQGSQPHTP